ncbi:MAG: type III-B CRISPR module RAMP protein Cmr6 [Rubrobacteraceae bacterium]|nr:type III-B CRISPR module RAMP protein Cmr6 [Rubrobacteraceae bacterium]
MRPLYREARGELSWEGGNAGLWYDKFFDRWQRDGTIADGGKLDWIKTVTGKPCGDRDLLREAEIRLARLVEGKGGEVLHYRLESDFVTGLGRQHPVENGFAWHHTLGTPYLPGSSIKGAVRAWAMQWAEGVERAKIKRIFGSEGKNDRDFHAGSVVFLDALPTAPVFLKADIMTPHYAPYYQGDDQGDEPPADWHSPNPIPFLVVKAGASFVFGILPRKPEYAEDCRTVKGWLAEALEWIGVGAKTAVGYGRFAEDGEARERFEKARKKEQAEKQKREEEERRRREIEEQTRDKSGLYAELFRASVEGRWREQREAFSQQGVIEDWMDRLESEPDRDAIELFDKFMRQHYGDVLKNPDATKGKKGKPKHKPRQRELAKRWLRIREEHGDG